MVCRFALLVSVASLALTAGCQDKTPTATGPARPLGQEEATPVLNEVPPAVSSFKRPETRTFQDWTAVCDNLNACVAYGAGQAEDGFVMVQIGAGPQARPLVQAGNWDLPMDSPDLKLSIDGQAFGVTIKRLATDEAIVRIPAASDQLLGAIAKGQALTLTAKGRSSHTPLNGAAAAMLWIDERQGRLDTPTALIRKGTRPASDVPPAPPRPSVAMAPPVAQTRLPTALPAAFAARDSLKSCAAANDDYPKVSEPWQVFRLGTNRLLYSMPCGSGAYNHSYLYLVSDDDGAGAHEVVFATSRENQPHVVNSEFDPATQSLRARIKGRGLGDCGQINEWIWTGQRFALISETRMERCLGLHWSLWPTTWVADALADG